MQRAMAHCVPREMAILGLVEFALSFALVYAALRTSTAPPAVSGLVATLSGATPFGTPVFGALLFGDGIGLAALIALSIGVIDLTVGLYQPEICLNPRRLLPAAGLAALFAFAAVLFISGSLGGQDTPTMAMKAAWVFAAWLAMTTLIRLVYSLDFVRTFFARRILLLGEPAQVAAYQIHLQSHRGRTFEPVARPAGDIAWPWFRQQRVWGVVIASGIDGPTGEALLDCKLRGIPVLSGAAFHERYLGRIDLDSMTIDDLLLSDGFAGGRPGTALKRIVDIVLSIVMLLLTLPLMAAAALAIKLDSHGPVFYRQPRIGQFGQIFTVMKFRSMTTDAEACGNPRWAQTQDPRVTRVGRVIRALRIDELPQLVNIIRGDMSLVGPRPERPHFVDLLARVIPLYRHRAYVKPGLTGWAQVNYPYGASVEDAREKLAYDLYYVKHRTIWLDLAILLSTVRVVLFREGAR
jgi:exopolysaccharide biosynthesis polyprenyl glycosylphosphotransferase